MSDDRRNVAELLNLAVRSAQMLAAADIRSIGQIRELSPLLTFLAVKQANQRPTWNLLWAIAERL